MVPCIYCQAPPSRYLDYLVHANYVQCMWPGKSEHDGHVVDVDLKVQCGTATEVRAFRLTRTVYAGLHDQPHSGYFLFDISVLT